MGLVGKDHIKLRTVCKYTDLKKAVRAGSRLRRFVSNTKNCLGLAANQLGILERVCVARIDGSLRIFINPVITNRRGVQTSKQEGCLSFPGIWGDVKRAEHLEITWLSVKRWIPTEHRQEFSGVQAIILEHEIDHLDGIRCIDKMKNITRG